MGNLTDDDLKKKGFSDEKIRIIKAGTHHQELGLPWDQPVPEELWIKVAEYCDNDVIATEAAFNYLEADWTARQILADLAEMTVNDTTNSLTTRIIFGNNRKPQSEFHYRNLAEPVESLDKESMDFLKEACPKMMEEPHYGWKYNDKNEVPFESHSILPYFPGYVFDHGKSTYRGEEVGEGGFAQGVPGMYGNVALLDISSMHPHRRKIMEGNKKPLMGVVVNCMNLNIRKDPTQASRSLGIIGSDTVVKVCNDESVSGFYKVKTVDGISGYCMSEFIKLC